MVYIDEHWPRPHAHDCASRGKETEGGCDYRVAGLDSRSHQREPECVGARGTADSRAGAGEGRDFAFQSFNLGT